MGGIKINNSGYTVEVTIVSFPICLKSCRFYVLLPKIAPVFCTVVYNRVRDGIRIINVCFSQCAKKPISGTIRAQYKYVHVLKCADEINVHFLLDIFREICAFIHKR